ncbi:hypothetical protein VNO77_27610 [Canavalia gladiata]|uniref:Uncharacterized protein n=1 Tax=Canavalia gladiata TaxID=3824 RepID=A0AAN9KVL4_CANGL
MCGRSLQFCIVASTPARLCTLPLTHSGSCCTKTGGLILPQAEISLNKMLVGFQGDHDQKRVVTNGLINVNGVEGSGVDLQINSATLGPDYAVIAGKGHKLATGETGSHAVERK